MSAPIPLPELPLMSVDAKPFIHSFDELIERAKYLFSPPAVACEVLKLTRDPGVSASMLRDCIERDPALAARILRVVNSSLFGLGGRCGSLKQALTVLGVRPLKMLVLGFSLPDSLLIDVAGDVLARYWRLTLTRAVAARVLAERYWRMPGDEAFLAGLLADLGQLVLIQVWQRPYCDLLRRTWKEGGDLAEVEKRALGFNHRDLSRKLLEAWQMPESILESLAPADDEPADPLAGRQGADRRKIVQLAGALAQALVSGNGLQRAWLREAAAACPGKPQISPDELAAELDGQVNLLADLLSVELGSGLDNATLLADAHRQLSDATERGVEDIVRAARERETAGVERVLMSDEIRILTQSRGERVAPSPVGTRLKSLA